MKKFVTLTLVLVMLLASAVAFADDTKSVELFFDLGVEEYEWSVPTSPVQIERAAQELFDITVSKLNLSSTHALQISFANTLSENDPSFMQFTDSTGAAKITGSLYIPGGDSPIFTSIDSKKVLVAANYKYTDTLTGEVTDLDFNDLPLLGKLSGTIAFKAEIVAKPAQ